MGISVKTEGTFTKTETLLTKITKGDYMPRLDAIGKKGVTALKAATPVDTGQTRDSWDYVILRDAQGVTITWTNSRTVEGYYYGSMGQTPLVILLVYGHGTKSGYYVPPNDFVTPAIKGVMQDVTNDVWKEVNRSK